LVGAGTLLFTATYRPTLVMKLTSYLNLIPHIKNASSSPPHPHMPSCHGT